MIEQRRDLVRRLSNGLLGRGSIVIGCLFEKHSVHLQPVLLANTPSEAWFLVPGIFGTPPTKSRSKLVSPTITVASGVTPASAIA